MRHGGGGGEFAIRGQYSVGIGLARATRGQFSAGVPTESGPECGGLTTRRQGGPSGADYWPLIGVARSDLMSIDHSSSARASERGRLTSIAAATPLKLRL